MWCLYSVNCVCCVRYVFGVWFVCVCVLCDVYVLCLVCCVSDFVCYVCVCLSVVIVTNIDTIRFFDFQHCPSHVPVWASYETHSCVWCPDQQLSQIVCVYVCMCLWYVCDVCDVCVCICV